MNGGHGGRSVLLVALGTRGDVEPFVRLGWRLRAEGYAVTVAVLEDGAARVRAAGLRPAVVGPVAAQAMWSGSAFLRAAAHLNPGLMWLQMRRALEVVAPTVAGHLAPLLRRADVVLVGLAAAGLVPVVTAAGVPARLVLLAPLLPHPGGTATWSTSAWDRLPHPLESARQALLWRMTTALSTPLASLLHGPRRAALPVTAPPAGPPLLATSAVLDPRPAPHAVSTGWWPDPSPVRTLPREVDRWLDRHPGAVLMAFGSMPGSSTRRTLERLGDVARSVGSPAVVQVRGASTRAFPGGLVVGEVDHRALLPRLAAVVHHGGSGTTHAVTAAGLPQVVVPHLGDQPHYARAVHRAGLGPPPLPRPLATRARLVARVRTALELGQGAPQVRSAASRLSGEDGLGTAARLVDAMAQ
ncbi:glycosyltransferase [Ornithinimicrobium cerasi]|uniref:glycosyltransferase n=1 Tax=Ornithinimicrobium cerasi TaxID=2248773 RepID=UPI000EFE446D|nr:glycosyltransferase [Ornithinimicrobium cerasi]